MAQKVLPSFTHVPGVHCGSTSLADVVRYRGLPLSEAMCFGLGAGLAFYYFPSTGEGPSRVFYGRTATMEEDFCANTGLGFVEQTEPDERLAWERVREKVDAAEPVILGTDVRYLPYYQTKTPFNGHRVVLAGYDPEAGTALLADTERPGLQPVSLADLHRARTSDGPPQGLHYSTWWEIAPTGPVRPLEESLPDALRMAARRALDDVTGFGGCDALARLASDLPEWKGLKDYRAAARYAYQVIEKRGTGGGLFRKLYAQFLAEAEQAAPKLPLAGLAAHMTNVADVWTKAAAALKGISEGEGAEDAAAQCVKAVETLERDFFVAVRERFGE